MPNLNTPCPYPYPTRGFGRHEAAVEGRQPDPYRRSCCAFGSELGYG